jgi:hypothetical protein
MSPAVILVVAAGGWYLWQQQKKKKAALEEESNGQGQLPPPPNGNGGNGNGNGNGGNGNGVLPCIPPHDQEAPSPYDAWLSLGEPVRLCDAPADTAVRVLGEQGLELASPASYTRDGEIFRFSKPNLYLVGNNEMGWALVAEVVPPKGAPIEGGSPDDPKKIIALPVDGLRLKGIDVLADENKLMVTTDGNDASQFRRAGDVIQFLSPGHWKVGGTAATDPHWSVTVKQLPLK